MYSGPERSISFIVSILQFKNSIVSIWFDDFIILLKVFSFISILFRIKLLFTLLTAFLNPEQYLSNGKIELLSILSSRNDTGMHLSRNWSRWRVSFVKCVIVSKSISGSLNFKSMNLLISFKSFFSLKLKSNAVYIELLFSD